MHTTLFAAIMAGSTGKYGFSGDRQTALENKDSDPKDGKTRPTAVPAASQVDPPAQVPDRK